MMGSFGSRFKATQLIPGPWWPITSLPVFLAQTTPVFLPLARAGHREGFPPGSGAPGLGNLPGGEGDRNAVRAWVFHRGHRKPGPSPGDRKQAKVGKFISARCKGWMELQPTGRS